VLKVRSADDTKPIPAEWVAIWSHCVAEPLPKKMATEAAWMHRPWPLWDAEGPPLKKYKEEEEEEKEETKQEAHGKDGELRIIVVYSKNARAVVQRLQQEQSKDKQWIISVDMDYFSVQNPTLPEWRHVNRSVYDFVAATRVELTDELFKEMKKERSLTIGKLMNFVANKAPNLPQANSNALTIMRAAAAINFLPQLTDFDYDVLHHAYLAHNISSQEQIDLLIALFEQTLSAIDNNKIIYPVLVASSKDYSDHTEQVTRARVVAICMHKYADAHVNDNNNNNNNN
jgi:hypothetical protein